MRDMLERRKDTFSASLSRVFALGSILLYDMLLYVNIFYYMILYVTICYNMLLYVTICYYVYLFYLFEILGEKVKDTQVHDINWLTVWTAGTKLRSMSPDHFHHDVLGWLIEGIYFTSCISSSKCDMLIEQDGHPTWYKIRGSRIVSSPHATPPSPRPV